MSNKREELAFDSIHELAPKIKDGSVSPVDITEIALERTAALNPKLNAFLDIWQDEALAAATKAEREIADGRYLGPMHGIPIGLKDLVDVAGKVTTGGSKVLQSNIAAQDATVTDRLNRAGAISIGKTNLVEFAFGAAGVNPYTGDARNPWDTDKITGGSSSGSGAGVAAGMVYGALGSDTGGSIRMPASLCGIAGFETYIRPCTPYWRPRPLLELRPHGTNDPSNRRLRPHAQRNRRARPTRHRVIYTPCSQLRGRPR